MGAKGASSIGQQCLAGKENTACGGRSSRRGFRLCGGHRPAMLERQCTTSSSEAIDGVQSSGTHCAAAVAVQRQQGLLLTSGGVWGS